MGHSAHPSRTPASLPNPPKLPRTAQGALPVLLASLATSKTSCPVGRMVGNTQRAKSSLPSLSVFSHGASISPTAIKCGYPAETQSWTEDTAKWRTACAGTVKGLTTQQLVDLDCHVILGNTYHLENRPGSDIVAQMGGLHGFIGWPRGMLTDSGGFQVCNARR